MCLNYQAFDPQPHPFLQVLRAHAAAEEAGTGSDANSIVADILTIARSPAFGGARDVAATSLADHLAAAEEALADLDIPQIIKPCTEEELQVARAGYDPDK